MYQTTSKLGVVSPLLEADPSEEDLSKLSCSIEDELNSFAKGKPEFNDINPNIKNYSFQDSINSENPKWHRPEIATIDATRDDATLENYLQKASQRLESPNYTLVPNPEHRISNGETVPDTQILIGDLEQKNGLLTIRDGDESQTVDIETAKQLLEQKTGTPPASGHENSYNTDEDITITPDFSTGFFQTRADYGVDDHISRIWVPYADSKKAIVVKPPAFDSEAESNVVSVPDKSYTGDVFADAVSDSLSYFLPFLGVPQTTISSEAVSHRLENDMSQEPYSLRIESKAWNKLDELDSEDCRRVIDNVYHRASNPGMKPLQITKEGKLDQIGSNENYILWREHDEERTMSLKNIYTDRSEVFRPGRRRT